MNIEGIVPRSVGHSTMFHFMWEPGDMTRYQMLVCQAPRGPGEVLVVSLMGSSEGKSALLQVPVSSHAVDEWLSKADRPANKITVYQFTQALEIITGYEALGLIELARTLWKDNYHSLAPRHLKVLEETKVGSPA